MRTHRLFIPAVLLLAFHQLPLFAQDPGQGSKPATQPVAVAAARDTNGSASTKKDTAAAKPDTIDNSWPRLECASLEARGRRTYRIDSIRPNHQDTAKRDTAWGKNQNGLIRDQQRLADDLACQGETGFVLRTGVDFTSADGFVGKNADLRASVAYNINFGGRWLPFVSFGRISRLSTTIRAERVSALVARSHFGCVGSVEPWSRSGGSPVPRLPENCALAVIGGDSATQTVFRPAQTPFRPDDYSVSGTWAVSALTRLETPLFSNTHVIVGPAFSVSFSTDPTGGTSRGLATSMQGGFSLRQLGEDHLERFSMLALWGRLYQFRQNVYTYDSTFVTTHPEVALMPGAEATSDGVTVAFGRNPRTNIGGSVQMMFQPLPTEIPNLYFRGAADFPRKGHRSASLAILLQGDLGALLRGLGITTTPSTPKSP